MFRGSQIDIFSDNRIKTKVRDKDGGKDLELLNKLPIKRLDYIDSIQHTNDTHIGVIAQDMEKIMPECVKEHPDFVPNYYDVRDIAEIDEASFAVKGEFLEKTGTKVKFYYVKDGGEKCATGVVCDGNIITHTEKSLGVSQVFLYGAEREDVKSVNYNTLYNLNISATQHLYRLVKELTETVKSQADRIKQLEKYSFTLS